MWIKIPGHIYDGLFDEEDREMRKRKQLLDQVFEASHITVKDALFATYKEVEAPWKHAIVSKGGKPHTVYVVYQGAVSVVGRQSFPTELPEAQIPIKSVFKVHSHKHAVLGSQFVVGLHETRSKTPFEYDIVVEDSGTILFSFDSDFFWMLVKTDWGFAKSVREKENEFNNSISKAFPRSNAPLVTATKIGKPQNNHPENSNAIQESLQKPSAEESIQQSKHGRKLRFKSDCCMIAKENSLTKLRRVNDLNGLQMDDGTIQHSNSLQGELEVVKGRKIHDLIQQMDRRNETIKMQVAQKSSDITDVINVKKVNKYNMSFHSNLFRRDRFADDIRLEHKRKFAVSMDGASPRASSNCASTVASELPASQNSTTWMPAFKPSKLKRFGFKKSKSIGGFDSGLSLEVEQNHLENSITKPQDPDDKSPFAEFLLSQPNQMKQENLKLQLNYKQLACMQQRPISTKQKQGRYLVFDSPRRQVSSSRSAQPARVMKAIRRSEAFYPSSMHLRDMRRTVGSAASSLQASMLVADRQAPEETFLEQLLNHQASEQKSKSNLRHLLAAANASPEHSANPEYLLRTASPTADRNKLTESFQPKSSLERPMQQGASRVLEARDTNGIYRLAGGLGGRLGTAFQPRRLLRTAPADEPNVRPREGALVATLRQGVRTAKQLVQGFEAESTGANNTGRTKVGRPADARRMQGVLLINDF